LVRRPLFGEIRVLGMSGQVGSVMGSEFGGSLFSPVLIMGFPHLCLFYVKKIQYAMFLRFDVTINDVLSSAGKPSE